MTATRCNSSTTPCNTPATPCNTPQHSGTHCKTPSPRDDDDVVMILVQGSGTRHDIARLQHTCNTPATPCNTPATHQINVMVMTSSSHRCADLVQDTTLCDLQPTCNTPATPCNTPSTYLQHTATHQVKVVMMTSRHTPPYFKYLKRYLYIKKKPYMNRQQYISKTDIYAKTSVWAGAERRIEVPPRLGFATSNWLPQPATFEGKQRCALCVSNTHVLRETGK